MVEFFQSISDFWANVILNINTAIVGNSTGDSWLFMPLWNNFSLNDLLLNLLTVGTFIFLFVFALKFIFGVCKLVKNMFMMR